MNANNQQVIDRLVGELKLFAQGELDLESIQSALQSVLTQLERDEGMAEQAIRLAEADVEEIRSTKLVDEQLSAVIFRLDELRDLFDRDFPLGPKDR